MARAKIKRHIVSVFMESPFYFTLPLRRGLELINFSSQHPAYQRICAGNENLINEQSDSKEWFVKT
jgi:hypothetical protein